MTIIKIKIFTRGKNFSEVVFNSQPTVLSFSSSYFGSPTDLVEDRTCHVDKELTHFYVSEDDFDSDDMESSGNIRN